MEIVQAMRFEEWTVVGSDVSDRASSYCANSSMCMR